MKSLKSKVILSALVLIFALVATIGSTFAWFTVSNTVSTSNIQLNVVSTDSLLIKLASYGAVDGDAASHLDAAAYSTSVTVDATTLTSDNGYIGGYNSNAAYSTWRLGISTAVQSTYAAVSGIPGAQLLLDTTAASNPKRTLAGAPVINSTSGGVITLKFWVMSQSADNKYLRVSELNVLGQSASPDGNTAIQESLRLSFHNSVTNAGWALPLQSARAYIFGNDIDYDFEFLPANSTTYFSGTDYTYVDPNYTLNGFNMIDDLIHGIVTAAPATTALTSADLLAYTVNGVNVHGVINTTNLARLVQNTPQLVTVTMFVDGWDADASDLLNTIPFRVSFKFTIAAIA